MKRLCLPVLIIILIPVVNAQFLYYNQNADKYAVLVSKYTSPSMDSNTIDYYQRLKNDFSVYIIPDRWVAENRIEWRDALNRSSLVFATSLNESVFGASRNNFCQNLANSLKSKRGLVFSSDSSFFNGDIYGCMQTPYFNISEPMNNTLIKSPAINITDNTGIAFGYDKKQYSLEALDVIYVINTTTGRSYATVYGDPDGNGDLPGKNYVAAATWNSLSYRILFWGIKTSALGSCATCLDWILFDQAINWVSNSSDMGFKLLTDKSRYKQGERITITIRADSPFISPSGYMYYPNGDPMPLFLEGSGNQRTSFYLLEDDAPSGMYVIKASDSGIESSKNISVGMFEISLTADNTTKEVEIEAEIKKDGSLYNNVNATLSVYSPSMKKSLFNFTNQGFILQVYNATESGQYSVALDVYEGSIHENATREFSYNLPPNIVLLPENITETVSEPGKIADRFVVIKNMGGGKATNITIEKEGNIRDWVSLYNTTLGDINSGTSQILRFNITVPQVGKGSYTGTIKILSDQTVVVLPLRVNFEKEESSAENISIDPAFISESLTVGSQKSISLQITNTGDAELDVSSITIKNSISQMVEISNKPSRLVPDTPAYITLNLRVPASITSLSQSYYGDLAITTNKKEFVFPSFILIKVFEDLAIKVDRFSDDISILEDEINQLGRSTDVSDLTSSLNKIKDSIQEVKGLYSGGDYSQAISIYNSIDGDIKKLDSDIKNKKAEIDQKGGSYTKYLFYFIAGVIAIAGGIFLLKKIRGHGKDKYADLYKKWGIRSRNYLSSG